MKSKTLALLHVAFLSAAVGGTACDAQFVDTSVPPPIASSPSPDMKTTAALLAQLKLATPPPVLIGPGDAFTVNLIGVKDYEAKERVDDSGTIILPLAGELYVSGLSVADFQRKIAKTLQDKGLVLNPQVNVFLTDSPSATVSIAGELNKPGSFPAFGRHTLYEYIALGGGLKATASRTVLLIRPGFDVPFEIPLGPDPLQSAYSNIPVFPGDSIVVPAIGFVYVVGAVKMQGGYPLKTGSQTTVLQAIGLAQGAGFEARLSSSVIVRTTPSGTLEIPVDIRKIMKGKTGDVALVANDILLVPTDQMRAAIKGGAANLAGTLASASIYRY